MKSLYILILLVVYVHAVTPECTTTKEKTCKELLEEMKELKYAKKINYAEMVGLFFFAASHHHTNDNDVIDLKLRLLRLKLNNCQ